jgi:hypothetical protein
MSKPSDDTQREIFDLLQKHFASRDMHWQIIEDLEVVMESEDGPELVRLMQKWMASI